MLFKEDKPGRGLVNKGWECVIDVKVVRKGPIEKVPSEQRLEEKGSEC